jgi:hypothetical protein
MDWKRHSSLDWMTKTDAQGRFTWDSAPAEPMFLTLTKPGYTMVGQREFQANKGETNVTMYPPLRVRGRVTDARTGQPIERFTVVHGITIKLWSGSVRSRLIPRFSVVMIARRGSPSGWRPTRARRIPARSAPSTRTSVSTVASGSRTFRPVSIGFTPRLTNLAPAGLRPTGPSSRASTARLSFQRSPATGPTSRWTSARSGSSHQSPRFRLIGKRPPPHRS